MSHDDPLAGQIITADWGVQLDTQGTYAPELTASTTNPNLGVGATQSGRWHRNGHLITGGAQLRYGTSGISIGSGNYQVSLPFPADTSVMTADVNIGLGSTVGSGSVRDNTASANWRTVTVYLATASVVQMHIATSGSVQDTAPFTWDVQDAISINFAYLADPAGLP